MYIKFKYMSENTDFCSTPIVYLGKAATEIDELEISQKIDYDKFNKLQICC